MTIEVEITTLDGRKHTKRFPHDLGDGSIEFVTGSGLLDVRLDPSEILPLVSREKEKINVSMAQYAYDKGKFRFCLESCNQVLSKKPQDSEAMYYKGRAFRKLGRFDLALKAFQQVIDLRDEDRSAEKLCSWSHIRRGYIFDLQGCREEALKEYEKALTFPDYQESRKEAEKRLNEPFSEVMKNK